MAKKIQYILEDIVEGIIAEKGFKAGILAGLFNGLIFFFIYLLIGFKVMPIGIFSLLREIFFISIFMVEGAIFGLIFGIFYEIIPIERSLYKAILLSLSFWFLVKLLPNLIILQSPFLFIETFARYLLKGILLSIFWETLSEN